LRNGSLAYADGYVFEIANAECGSPKELIALDKANMTYLTDEIGKLDLFPVRSYADGSWEWKKIPEEIRGIYIYKANTDLTGKTLGTHENYQVFKKHLIATNPRLRLTRDNPPPNVTPAEYRNNKKYQHNMRLYKYLAHHLTTFLATRQLFAGSGDINFNRRNNAQYILSPRAMKMEKRISLTTLNERGIVNTRDESHADDTQFLRLHLICGDANMNEVAGYLKIGVTSMMLHLIEHTRELPDLSLISPVAEMHAVAHDLTGKTHKLKLYNGHSYSALELQLMYRDMLGKHLLAFPDPTYQAVFDKYSQVLETMRTVDPVELTTICDHALKYKLLQELVLNKGKSLKTTTAQVVNLRYHRLDAEGLYNKIASKEGVERIVTDEEVQQFYGESATPPQTRAFARMKLMDALREQRVLPHAK